MTWWYLFLKFCVKNSLHNLCLFYSQYFISLNFFIRFFLSFFPHGVLFSCTNTFVFILHFLISLSVPLFDTWLTVLWFLFTHRKFSAKTCWTSQQSFLIWMLKWLKVFSILFNKQTVLSPPLFITFLIQNLFFFKQFTENIVFRISPEM